MASVGVQVLTNLPEKRHTDATALEVAHEAVFLRSTLIASRARRE